MFLKIEVLLQLQVVLLLLLFLKVLLQQLVGVFQRLLLPQIVLLILLCRQPVQHFLLALQLVIQLHWLLIHFLLLLAVRLGLRHFQYLEQSFQVSVQLLLMLQLFVLRLKIIMSLTVPNLSHKITYEY